MSKFDYSVCLAAKSTTSIQLAANELADIVYLVTGKNVDIFAFEDVSTVNANKKIVLSLFSENEVYSKTFKSDYMHLLNSDGFAVRVLGEDIVILSHTPAGVFFGVHDFLEKNFDVVFSRGAEEMAIDFIESENVEIKIKDYCEKSPFTVRAYQMCGEGKKGLDHIDDGTALYLARNKINGTAHGYSERWYDFGLKGFFSGFGERNALDEYLSSHPEYFMSNFDGSPRKGYTNYYNSEVPKIYAKEWYRVREKDTVEKVFGFGFPDDPYFCMMENGERLDKKPFTTDDGVTVFPEEKNYKSTVYCNFLNRLMREMKKYDKIAQLFTLAYIYSEAAPAIQLEDGIIVVIAAITTNERYSYVDPIHKDNLLMRENILEWRKKCKEVGVYTYWNSFKGYLYSRPILKQVQENLLWFKKIGVTCIDTEGSMDCSRLEKYTVRQNVQRKYYDMNEAWVNILFKLLWNPEIDIFEALKRYVRIVYKESAEAMYEYFLALQEGWDKSDATVWYSTGGDVYTLDFIINAGMKDRVLSALKTAKSVAVTPRVKQKVESIYKNVTGQLETYGNFIKETGVITRVKASTEEILSEKNLAVDDNAESIWNKAIPMKVFRNYQTMEFFDPKAKFECRMLANDECLFVGYRLYDDRIVKAEWRGDNFCAVLDNGKALEANAENYIGGNSFNKSVYYGYMSGFSGDLGKNLLYENAGTPIRIPIPEGMRDVKFVKTDDDPAKRYVFHVQVIPYRALGVEKEDFRPYGSIVYLTYRYGRAGWMGYGLWCKQSFSEYEIRDLEEKK